MSNMTLKGLLLTFIIQPEKFEKGNKRLQRLSPLRPTSAERVDELIWDQLPVADVRQLVNWLCSLIHWAVHAIDS